MLHKLAIFFAAVILSLKVHADICDLADEDNFPNTVCSVTSQGDSFTQLRFGRIDELLTGSNEDEIILRSGASIFVINETTEILQEVMSDDDVECGSVEMNSQLLNEESAYILETDSLNAPRTITKIWILGCEVSQPR
mgnify:CR=1 FL=1